VSGIPFLNTFEFESVGANIEAFTPLIVTQRERSATTATLTTELNHGLTTGDKIRVFGVGLILMGCTPLQPLQALNKSDLRKKLV